MARTVTQIQNQIIAQLQSDKNLYDPANPDPSRRGLTSTSQTAIWKLLTFIVAVAINLFEQLLDIFIVDVETRISAAAPGTPSWIRQQCLLFQWSSTTDQIIQFDTVNIAPYYPTVNAALRIITQCAVTSLPNKIVLVKVATGGSSPAPLSSPQQDALTSYLDYLNFAGVYFQLVSTDADFAMIGADIFYDGQYANSIQAAVTAAINSFIANLPFNGMMKLSLLEDAIQAVPGVTDVTFSQVECRVTGAYNPNTVVKLVDNYTVLIREYSAYAGYMIIDTAVGRDLATTLNFIVSNN